MGTSVPQPVAVAGPAGAIARRRPVMRRLRAPHLANAALAAALVLSYPLLLAVAVLPGPRERVPACWLFLAVAVVSYLAEALAQDAVPSLVNMLNWVQVGLPLRFAFRELALIVLLLRVLPVRPGEIAVLAGGLLGLHAIRAVYSALVVYVGQWRLLPVVTRNVDLSELRIPDPPPPSLTLAHTRKMLHLDVLPLAGGLAWALTRQAGWMLGGVCLALTAGAAGCAVMAVHARRNAHLRDRAWVLRTVSAQVRQGHPQVMLYFSGQPESVYQANMWLSTLARVNRPAVIVMRERWTVPMLGRTSLPVVCLEDMLDLLNFPLPSVRVALFPANTAKNLHQLRIPGVGQVFINHGDSDKDASVNPFAKAYDEVWVAGAAGRERYLRAQAGVRDEDIVEVGRPQLADIRPAPGAPGGRMFTVLYAPTWEGFTSGAQDSSLIPMGLRIVQALTDRMPGIRVLYKPHPLTGTRDPRAARAHEAVAAFIEQANRRRERTGEWAQEAAASAPARAAALAELARIEERLRKLSGDGQIAGSPASPGGRSDYAALSRDGQPDPARDAEWRRCLDAWHEAYCASQGWWEHRVATGARPTAYDCLSQADLLISDISSLVADFLVSGRPYAVTDLAGRGAAAFHERFPTAVAGYLLSPDCAELPGILQEATGAGEDRLGPARRELKRYLLGPDTPAPQTRFNSALDALIERVEAARRAVAGTAAAPPRLAAQLPTAPGPAGLPTAGLELASDPAGA